MLALGYEIIMSSELVLYLSREFSASGCLSLEQTGGLFLSFSFSERLEGKLSMYSNRAGVDGGASKTLCEKRKGSYNYKRDCMTNKRRKRHA